jgi:hypothetical protein
VPIGIGGGRRRRRACVIATTMEPRPARRVTGRVDRVRGKGIKRCMRGHDWIAAPDRLLRVLICCSRQYVRRDAFVKRPGIEYCSTATDVRMHEKKIGEFQLFGWSICIELRPTWPCYVVTIDTGSGCTRAGVDTRIQGRTGGSRIAAAGQPASGYHDLHARCTFFPAV